MEVELKEVEVKRLEAVGEQERVLERLEGEIRGIRRP